MRREVLFPKLSTKIETGTIVNWLKPVGSQVAVGDVLYETETEKAVHEVEAPFAGEVVEVLTTVGDEVTVDQVLAIIETEGA